LPTIHVEFNKRHFVARVLFHCFWCDTCLLYNIILGPVFKHVRLTCGFNKLMMMRRRRRRMDKILSAGEGHSLYLQTHFC